MSSNQRAPRSALSESVSAFFQALGAGAAGVGTTSTSVLRFVAANTVVESPYLAVTDDAAEGTLVQIETAGMYAVSIGLGQIASTDLIIALSIGTAAVSPITGVPVLGQQGVIATMPVSTLPASTTMGHVLTRIIKVPDEEANTTRAILRFRAAVAAGTTPIPAVTVATAWASIERICDAA